MFMLIHVLTLYIVQDQVKDLVPISMTASDLNIPGIYLVHDFVSAKEEEVYWSFPSMSMLHCFA